MKQALSKNSPMTNANPLITLRNNAILWCSITVLFFGGAWWIDGFFADIG